MDNTDAIKHHLVRGFNEPSNLTMPGTRAPLYAQSCIELVTLEKVNGAQKRKTQHYWNSKVRKLQNAIFNVLERPSTTLALFYHSAVFCLILASLFLSVIITIAKYEKSDDIQNSVYYLEVSLMMVFSIEYILRLWSSSSHGNYKGFWGKLRFIRKPYMVIDIIVIVATAIVIVTTRNGGGIDHFNVSMFRFLRFLQVLRILRLDRQRGAFKIVSHIFYEHRQELLTCWYMSFILLIACSFLVYLAEKSDDKVDEEKGSGEMRDLGEGIYWGMITLLTIGYGDIAPQNWMAKIITCIFAFIGTAFFALPAGILGSGFALQVAQNQKQKHFNRRRFPAAVAIQYAWRLFAANPSYYSTATWVPHQVIVPPVKDKKFSLYHRGVGGLGGTRSMANGHTNGDITPTGGTATPQALHKNMTYFQRKLQKRSLYPDGHNDIQSSIGATIPSALELRDHRSHSEGNLLLISPNNVEEHQATIVSLPPTMISDYTEGYMKGKNFANVHGYYSNPDIQLKPLTDAEKNAIRFLRKVKLYISIRKFKEEKRPYDVKDVIEQYTEGQLDMFGFIKKFQVRVEGALGIKGDNIDQSCTVNNRLSAVERKVEIIDDKIDHIIDLLREHKHGRYYHDTKRDREPRSGMTSSDDVLHIPHDMTYNHDNGNLSDRTLFVPNQQKGTFEPEDLNYRLQKLKYDSNNSSVNGSSSYSIASNSNRIDRARADSRFKVTPTVLTTVGIDIEDEIKIQSEKRNHADMTELNVDNENIDVYTDTLDSDLPTYTDVDLPLKSASYPSELSFHFPKSDNTNSGSLPKVRHSSSSSLKLNRKVASPPYSLSNLFSTDPKESVQTVKKNKSVPNLKTFSSQDINGHPNAILESPEIDYVKPSNSGHLITSQAQVIENPSFDLDV